MSQSFNSPQLNKVYSSAEDSNWLGQSFDLERGESYIFVKVLAGNYIRQGDAVNINSESECVPCYNGRYNMMGVAEWDIDASLTAQYSLVNIKGNRVPVSFAPDSVTSCHERAIIVPFMNSQTRASNVAFTLNVKYAHSNSDSCLMWLTNGVTSNCNILCEVGDVISTNTNIVGTIVRIPNGSSIIIATGTTGVANVSSVLCQVVATPGLTMRSNGHITCATVQWKLTVGGLTGYPTKTPISTGFNQVNVCSAGTVMFVNSCVSGQLIKVGDILTIQQMSNYSNRAVTSINNAYAFTVNAAASAENSFVLGQGINVNSRFVLARINTY